MPKTPPVLGRAVEDGADIIVNVEELIGSDICIVANKGAGKSGMQRVLLEATHGLIRQVVIDPEGEYHTLRQIGDYLIAGGDEADCPATISNAALLAQMLMENPGISAVVQLDHLKPWEQEEFVGLFLEAIMAAPRAQWAPMLLDIDETHRFAPQDGNVASSAAMRDIIGRGRKRGITPVFATYRVAAIDKNVTAGSPTWFMGRVGQEIDRKAAALAMGFAPSSAEAKEISFLPKRRFWTYGSATTPRPVLFDVADARTTMTKAGQAMAPVPPAPKSLQKLVQALAKAAAPETPAAPAPAAPDAPTVDLEAIRKEAHEEGVGIGYDAGLVQGQGHVLDRLEEWIAERRHEMLGGDINVGVDDRDGGVVPALDLDRDDPEVAAHLARLQGLRVPARTVHVSMDQPVKGDFVKTAATAARAAVAANPAAQSTNVAGLAMLEALTRHYPMKLTWAQLAGFSGRKARGGSFNTAKRWLLDNDLVIERGDNVEAAPAGLAMKPPPAQGEDKIQSWANALPAPADQLLLYLVDHPGQTPEELAAATGRQPRGGSWHTALRHLKSNDLVEEVDGRLSASAWLFD